MSNTITKPIMKTIESKAKYRDIVFLATRFRAGHRGPADRSCYIAADTAGSDRCSVAPTGLAGLPITRERGQVVLPTPVLDASNDRFFNPIKASSNRSFTPAFWYSRERETLTVPSETIK